MTAPYLHKIVTNLVDEQLAAREPIRFRVTSNSMAPLIRAGDTVTVKRVDLEQYRLGDVIVIRREHDYLTHRLIRKSGATWLTKGDNTLHSDLPVSLDVVLGRVSRVQGSDYTQDLQTPRQRKIASLLAKLSELEWRAYNITPSLRLPVRLATKILQRIALLESKSEIQT